MKTIYTLQEPAFDEYLVGNYIPAWKIELLKMCYN